MIGFLIQIKTPISDPWDWDVFFTIVYGMFYHYLWFFFYPCMVYLPLFNNIWLFFLMVHVRKDTGPMDPMGMDVEADFQTKAMLKLRLFFEGRTF